MHPMTFNIIRFGISSILLFLLLLKWQGWQKIKFDDWILIAIQGFLNVFAYQYLFINSLSDTHSGIAAVLTSTTPLWTALLMWLSHYEAINKWLISGVLIGFIGVAMVVTGGMNSLSLNTTSKAELTMLLSAIVWSIGTLITKNLLNRYSPIRIITLSMLIGYIGIFACGFPYLVKQNWQVIGSEIWVAIAFSTIFAIAIGYSCWSWAIHKLGATKTTVLGNITPIVAFISAYLISKETIAFPQIIGSAIVILGIWLAKKG
jgi:drug/metabolite transporter (DMT)-like permease